MSDLEEHNTSQPSSSILWREKRRPWEERELAEVSRCVKNRNLDPDPLTLTKEETKGKGRAVCSSDAPGCKAGQRFAAPCPPHPEAREIVSSYGMYERVYELPEESHRNCSRRFCK